MRKDFYHNNTARYNKELEALFESLVQQHEQKLILMVHRVVKSESQSRDIVQNVFLKVWEHRDSIYSVQNMEAWLYRITKNELTDFLRKAAADERLRATLWNNLQLSTHYTEELLNARECHSILHKAISRLPPQRRLVYRLNRDKGLSYQEIATELSISRHTVKNQLSLALQSIHRFLSGSTGLLLMLLANTFTM
ncbi:MAG: RNA polymerase sigma-70 factor [Chitinophagaceae bacterium]|nr:RNA polymerase sigma-70 factor [Chitinophagaceae bacterium]